MILHFLLIVLGIIVVLWGADKLTEGAVALAGRLGMSQLVIGLTVVALGTSMPEFCVSLVSALRGTSDLAVGNVVGSNIFNTMLIVGCAAVVSPMSVSAVTVRKDLPFALLASVALLLMCLDGLLSRTDAALLFVVFLVFMGLTLRGARSADDTPAAREPMPWGRALAWMAVGLVCLVVGSNVFVGHATALAQAFGVSEAVIGLTIVAGGTSLPELATSIVAARKGNSGIAIGNVLGSNVFNILFILSLTGLICPMSIHGITTLDFSMMIGSMLLLWLFAFTRLRVERWEGAVLTVLFMAYMGWLVWQAV